VGQPDSGREPGLGRRFGPPVPRARSARLDVPFHGPHGVSSCPPGAPCVSATASPFGAPLLLPFSLPIPHPAGGFATAEQADTLSLCLSSTNPKIPVRVERHRRHEEGGRRRFRDRPDREIVRPSPVPSQSASAVGRGHPALPADQGLAPRSAKENSYKGPTWREVSAGRGRKSQQESDGRSLACCARAHRRAQSAVDLQNNINGFRAEAAKLAEAREETAAVPGELSGANRYLVDTP